MMGQNQKPVKEILEGLNGRKKIVIMGCGGCSTVFHTGGKDEIEEMGNFLTQSGKEVVKVPLAYTEFACYQPISSAYIKKYEKEFRDCDAVLMMSCGDGLQTVRVVLDEEFNIIKPIYPANNSLGAVGGGPKVYIEKCQSCGECTLGRTAGICPLTACPKGLLNGPCGGTTSEGKCEVDPEKDCAWYMIYNRLKEIGEVDKIVILTDPKDWNKSTTPRVIIKRKYTPKQRIK